MVLGGFEDYSQFNVIFFSTNAIKSVIIIAVGCSGSRSMLGIKFCAERINRVELKN